MATTTREMGRIGEYRLVVDKAGSQFVTVAVAIILGLPIVTYLSGVTAALFYVHITLAAVWVGTDFFFRYSLAPAVGRSGPETAMALIPNLTPRLMVVGESLTLGVIGSGIGLAYRLGHFVNPVQQVFAWGAVVIAVVVVFFAFVPLHRYQIEMLLELDSPEPDGERVGALNDTAMTWLMGMTGLLLLMLLMMVGMRGLIPL